MIKQNLNFDTAPGYEILAAAGKTVLRPSGRAATEQLFQWANFKPGETVLELASGLGASAIALARHFGVEVVGIEKDPDWVVIAQANAKAAGLERQVRFIQGNIFELETVSGSFDYVLAEAILTMQSPVGKARFLSGVRDRLKASGKFLSHELLARSPSESLHRDLSQATRVKAAPLSEANWTDAFTQAGLTVTQQQTGSMRLLDPFQVIQDEGLVHTAQMIGNILTQPVIRDRILEMRQVFTQHQQDLGYIALRAIREAV